MDIFDGNFSSIPSTENIEQPQTLNGSLLDGLEEENDLVIDQPTVNVTDPVEQFVEEEQNRLGDIGLELGLGQTPKEQVDDEKASEVQKCIYMILGAINILTTFINLRIK